MLSPEREITDPLTGYSENLDETVTERSRKPLPGTTGLYPARSITESTVTIKVHEVTIPESLDQATKMARVPDETEPFFGLRNTMDQPDSDRRMTGQESNPPFAGPNDPEPTEYDVDRLVGHHGTGARTEHTVPYYGYSAEDNTYEPASELPANFVRRHWTTRWRHHASWIEQTKERAMQRQK